MKGLVQGKLCGVRVGVMLHSVTKRKEIQPQRYHPQTPWLDSLLSQ